MEVAKVESLNIIKKLDIGHKRICNCPPNHINCLTAKEWIKNQINRKK